MVKRTGPTNSEIQKILLDLKILHSETKDGFWKKLIKELDKPSRQKTAVNISKINRFTKEGDFVVVPRKLLSSGDLNHKVTLVTTSLSQSAKEKLKDNAKIITFEEFVKAKSKPKNVKIIC